MTRTVGTAPTALLAGLALVGALAGCAADTGGGSATVDEPDGTVDDSATDDSATDDGATGTDGSYADGTYTEDGQYQSPNGTESLTVTVTLAGDIVTGVEVTGDASNPNTKLYQGEFIAGIGALVVGKDIDSLQVDKVGGSSLASGGFNAALERIKADAAR